MPAELHEDNLAIIPLRAGSKGLPGKNLRRLAGKPLYEHSLEQALRVVGRCAITTDIADVLMSRPGKQCRLIPRPADLAGDETPMTPVLMHVFEYLSQRGTLPETAILMQATSPLRRDEDIRTALDLYRSGQHSLVMSVVKSNPGILKHGFVEDGCFRPVSRPEYCFSNRQALPGIVRPNGAVYVFSPAEFLQRGGLATQSIGAVEMPEECSIDIDTAGDLQHAESRLQERALAKAA